MSIQSVIKHKKMSTLAFIGFWYDLLDYFLHYFAQYRAELFSAQLKTYFFNECYS